MPSPSSSRKRKEPSSPTETNSNTTKDAKLASGLYKETGGQLKKLCSEEGCGSFAQQGGFCYSHGAKKTTCSYEGCGNQACNSGVCYMHGAKKRICSHEGCGNFAQQGGVCCSHGAKRAERKICSYEGCSNIAINSGVCCMHGAKMRICSHEGCENQARRGEVCTRHGAKRLICSYEGCTKYAQRKGVCYRHGANKFIKKRKSSALVSDNEDDTNDNQKRRTCKSKKSPEKVCYDVEIAPRVDDSTRFICQPVGNGITNSLGENDDSNRDNQQNRTTHRHIQSTSTEVLTPASEQRSASASDLILHLAIYTTNHICVSDTDSNDDESEQLGNEVNLDHAAGNNQTNNIVLMRQRNVELLEKIEELGQSNSRYKEETCLVRAENEYLRDRLQCPYCYEVKDEMYVMLPCRHRTCFDCHFKIGRKCPQGCKEAVQVKRLF